MKWKDKYIDKVRQDKLDKLEHGLTVEVSKFFKGLNKELLQSLEEYYNPDYLLMRLERITEPLTSSHNDYFKILEFFDRSAYRNGVDEANHLFRLVNSDSSYKSVSNGLSVSNEDDLWSPSEETVNELLKDVFASSMNTLLRMHDLIRAEIIKGYKTGKGISYIAGLLRKRFMFFCDFEAVRIARTETHNAHNRGAFETYKGLGVEYTMWITSHDNRVREFRKGDKADHMIMDRQIKPLNGYYSNGLMYPGDVRGPVVEWINCRCRNAPYVLPPGKLVPVGKPYFYEKDLI